MQPQYAAHNEHQARVELVSVADKYPLTWPDGWPRTKSPGNSQFKSTLASALKNVQKSLEMFARDSGKKTTAKHADLTTAKHADLTTAKHADRIARSKAHREAEQGGGSTCLNNILAAWAVAEAHFKK